MESIIVRDVADRPSIPRTVEELRTQLAAAGLGEHSAALAALARTSIRLVSRTINDSRIALGASKLGGHPDLLASFEWPWHDGIPLSFVAQINLADMPHEELSEQLPTTGLLSFFYDAQQRVWGFDPADAGGWSVFFFDHPSDLAPAQFPDKLPEVGRFRCRALDPRTELTFAPWEFAEVEALNLTRDQLMAYSDLIADDDARGPRHRLLGHPDPVQGDMQLECQLAANGLSAGNPKGYRDPRAAELKPGAVRWRLLLQIDTDDEAGMMWGDVGTIYYWIHESSLAARRWNETWLCLQCC